LGIGKRWNAGRSSTLQLDHDFRDLPFPHRPDPADTAGPTEALDSGIILPPVAPERRPVALAIAEAAHRLNTLRENWLNPPEWVDRVPEIVPGYPDRIIPKPAHAAELKKRTLTNLYNARPAWLDHAHQALDVAVAAAYGWADYTLAMPEDESPAAAAGPQLVALQWAIRDGGIVRQKAILAPDEVPRHSGGQG
jgi:hypothetical protein